MAFFKEAINSLSGIIVAQIVCYSYTFLYKNCDFSLSKDKINFDKLKEIFWLMEAF